MNRIIHFEDVTDHSKFAIDLLGPLVGGQPIPAPPADWVTGYALLRDETPYRWITENEVNRLMDRANWPADEDEDHDIWLRDFNALQLPPIGTVCIECKEPIAAGELAIKVSPTEWICTDEDCGRQCGFCGLYTNPHWTVSPDLHQETVCGKCNEVLVWLCSCGHPYDEHIPILTPGDDEGDAGECGHVDPDCQCKHYDFDKARHYRVCPAHRATVTAEACTPEYYGGCEIDAIRKQFPVEPERFTERLTPEPYEFSFNVVVKADDEDADTTHVAIFHDTLASEFGTFSDIENISISEILKMKDFIGSAITLAVLKQLRERGYKA